MDLDLNFAVSGSGIPVVFQHGLGANLQQAQGLLAEMDGVQLISMDCRGHGGSVLSAGYLPSFDAYTDDLLRLLDHLNIERAVFGGISMGSGISLNMAIRHPDRVRGLILVRPAWLAAGRPANLEILLDLIPYLNQDDGQKKFKQTPEYREIRSVLPRAAASIMGQFDRDQGEATADILTHMVEDAPFGDMQFLSEIKVPALVIGNADDPLHPLEMAEVISAEIPNSEFKKVTSRYLNDREHKVEVRQAVSAFLSKNDLFSNI